MISSKYPYTTDTYNAITMVSGGGIYAGYQLSAHVRLLDDIRALVDTCTRLSRAKDGVLGRYTFVLTYIQTGFFEINTIFRNIISP